MGTNYYLHDGRHIGKCSVGWKFLFEKYPWEIFTIEEYQNKLREGCIIDEYDRKYTFKDFWLIVESFQKEKAHETTEGFPNYEQISGYDFVNNPFS